MRYIIGYQAIDKLKQKHPDLINEDQGCKGIYVMGYLLPYILTKKTTQKIITESKISVFENLEVAQKEITKLSKAYRRDDVAFTNKKSRFIRHFFLIKLDSPKCPIIIDENSKEKSKKGDYYWYNIKSLRINFL